MGIVGLIIVLLILGFIGWVATVIPMEGTIKTVLVGIIIFVAVIIVLFWLLSLFHVAVFPQIR